MRPREAKPADVSQRGLSLVELLVAMSLGLFLSAIMVGAYVGAKRTYFYSEQAARIQENGRYALRLLTRELGMAGFYAGLLTRRNIAPVPVTVDCSARIWALDALEPLALVDDYVAGDPPLTVDSTLLTCLDGDSIAPGTDILAVKRTAAEASLRRGVPAAQLAPSTVQNWYLRVRHGRYPQWTQLRPLDLLDPALVDSSQSYWRAVSRIFFVRKYSEQQGDDIPGLCIETLAGTKMTARCLVQGVENLQLEFGIDTDADGVANRYYAAPAQADMKRAVSARIYLLLRSLRPVTGHTDTEILYLG